MPELPEVENLRRGLERAIIGLTIVDVEIPVSKILQPPVTDPVLFRFALVGQTIATLSRRGKHLLFHMSSGYALYAHLKMRGQFLFVESADVPFERYVCAVFSFDNGSQLRYHDMWTWGELRVVKNPSELFDNYVPALASMGPEPLTGELTGAVLRERAKKRLKSPIKSTLLDQDIVAGVGNIYADESLHRANISPERLVGEMSMDQWSRLAEEIVAVLGDAVGSGGTRSDNYVDIEGQAGRFEPRVYDRAGKPCLKCGTALKRMRIGGRGTVYCSTCQS